MTLKALWFLFLWLFLFTAKPMSAQDDDGMIRTTDGHAIATKSSFIAACKKMYGAARGDSMVAKACECHVSLLNNYFTTHQLGFFQTRYKEKALQILIEQDLIIQKKLQQCGAPVENLQLLSVPSSRKIVIKQCVESLKKQSEKPVNDTLATKYCSCASDIIQKRKITVKRIEELTDPSSFLFNEIAYQCGSPFFKALGLCFGMEARR